MTTTILLALLLPACQSTPDLTPEGRKAFTLLQKAQRFTDDAVGDGGETPPEVRALCVLWKERAPADAFRELLRSGTTAGKLYALCGLREAAPETFEKEVGALRQSREEVAIQFGCTGGKMPAGEIVASERGIRLEPGQTVAQWVEKHPVEKRSLDIVGGGYGSEFRKVCARMKPKLSPEGEEALAVLLKADMFSNAAVGIAAMVPPPVVALQKLWKEPEANQALRHVLSHGTLPGQLFALCGLHESAPDVFRAAVEPYRKSRTKVPTMFGCIVGEEEVATVVETHIASGTLPKSFKEAKPR